MKVGNNVRIGANCVVVEDIKDNCVVVLHKPRVIQKSDLDNRYLTKDVDGKWVYRYGDGKLEEMKE